MSTRDSTGTRPGEMKIALCHSSDLEHISSGELHLISKTNGVAIAIRLNSLTFFVNSRPYGTKPFDVTEDGEVEQLSVIKVTT